VTARQQETTITTKSIEPDNVTGLRQWRVYADGEPIGVMVEADNQIIASGGRWRHYKTPRFIAFINPTGEAGRCTWCDDRLHRTQRAAQNALADALAGGAS